jgi:hypothetical protein
MFKDESPQMQLFGSVDIPPVAAEITSPLPFIDAFDDVSPRTLDSIPALENSEIMPRKDAKVLAREAKEWNERAANVQAVAFVMAATDTVIWTSMNVYSFLESQNPEGGNLQFSHGLYTATSIGMIICGAVMTCAAATAASYRSRNWRIKRRLRAATIVAEAEEA